MNDPADTQPIPIIEVSDERLSDLGERFTEFYAGSADRVFRNGRPMDVREIARTLNDQSKEIAALRQRVGSIREERHRAEAAERDAEELAVNLGVEEAGREEAVARVAAMRRALRALADEWRRQSGDLGLVCSCGREAADDMAEILDEFGDPSRGGEGQ